MVEVIVLYIFDVVALYKIACTSGMNWGPRHLIDQMLVFLYAVIYIIKCQYRPG